MRDRNHGIKTRVIDMAHKTSERFIQIVQLVEEGRVLEAERLWNLHRQLLLSVGSIVILAYFLVGFIVGSHV